MTNQRLPAIFDSDARGDRHTNTLLEGFDYDQIETLIRVLSRLAARIAEDNV